MTFAMVRLHIISTGTNLNSSNAELGILVWQDFMFGCGQVSVRNDLDLDTYFRAALAQYPAYDSFVKLVTLEAEQNVKRLRHHPSIVIFGRCIYFTYLGL